MAAALDTAPTGSLGRGLALLAILAESPRRGLGLSEMADHAGFDKATTHRLARTLVRHGCLVQERDTKRYRLGVRVLDLGFAYLAGLDLREVARPCMQELATEFGGRVSLAQLDGADVVYLERIPARQWTVSLEMRVGSRLPAHMTSLGKALLACHTDAQVRALLHGRRLQAPTPVTLTGAKSLLVQLEQVRVRGFAVNDQETVIGLRSAAAAIRGHEGAAVAALNVAVSAAQHNLQDLLDHVGPRVAEAACEISTQLGYRPAREAEWSR